MILASLISSNVRALEALPQDGFCDASHRPRRNLGDQLISVARNEKRYIYISVFCYKG